jgi:hypothetical protein
MRQLLARKSSNEVVLPDDASLGDITTAWDKQTGKPPKDDLFHAQVKARDAADKGRVLPTGVWNYDFLREILPPNANGDPLSNAEIDEWLPQVRTAEPEDGPRLSENRVLLQGHDLFMALHGGPIRRGRSHGRNLIHVEYSLKRPTVEMPEGAERVLTEIYDSPTLLSLGLWLDRNAADRPTVKSDPKARLPKTASHRLRYIRQRLIEKKDVTMGMIKDALIDRGLAKVENGRLIVEPGFVDKVISTTLGVEKSFGDLTLSERFMVLERVLQTEKQVVHTSEQKPIREDTGLERSQRRLILERIRDAGNEGFNLHPNSNQMKELLADLGLIEETTLDVVSEEDALEMTEEDLIEARDREKDKEDRGAVVVFGEEGAKAYEQAQRISNTTRPELIDSPAQKEADDLIERMESGLSPEQERILFGIGEKGLNAEELTSLAREAGIYQLSQISQDSDQEIIDSFKFLAGGERSVEDLGVRYGLRRIAAEAQNRGISGQVLIEATLARMSQRGVDPANASEYLSDRLATWMQMGAPVGRKQLAKPAIQPAVKKEAVRLVKNFVETVEVVERVGKGQKVKIARPESRPKVVVTDEQVETAQVKEEAQKVVEEGTNEETRQAEEEGGKQWRDEQNPDKPASKKARTAEAVRAQQRIKALKRSLRERAIRLLGRKKGSEIAIEIEASFDSIYEDYVKAVANRNQPAYLDTYTGVLVFNISQLEQQYADDPKYRDLTKVPIEMLARNAMLHEGAHVLFLNGVLTPQEQRNLRLYGERQRVPEEVSKDAVNPTDKTRMTWRQWIESQPGNDRLNDAELVEEMQVQILDALASGTIPGSKAAGAIGIIKQRMMQRIKILLGIQKEGGLSSILSVFDKLQDQVEVARRMEVAEEHGLADLRFAERADPNDLKDIVEAMKAGDEAKVKELATMIAHKRTKGVEIISPTQQFMNEMRARGELEDTPKGIISVLNGGAIVDGTISPAALNEYFKIQDGQAPYMMDKPRRELLGRRRPRALTDDDEALIKRAEERDKEQGIGDTSSRDASEIISINKVADGEILDATPEDIRKVWEYSAKMRYRKAYLDKRLPQALSSERAAARRKAWGIQSMIDSITAWRYADNSQSFLPALWERGPIEKTRDANGEPGGGYVIVQDRDVSLQEEKVITPGGVEVTLNREEVIRTSGLAKLFERVIDKLTLKVTRQYGEAARVIGTRGRLDEQRREFVRRMAEAGVRIDIDTGEGVRLGGLKLTGQGTPILKKTPKVKGKPKQPDMAVLVRINKPKNLTPEQEAIWNEYADPRQGKIGVWQRRYDRVNTPGTYKKKNQNQRYNELLSFLQETQQAAVKNPKSMASDVIDFWRNYRAYNDVLIDLAFDSDLIDETRRDLYKSLSFMPFYRDNTGWSDASVFENSNSPEALERAARLSEARKQDVAADAADKVGTPLIDRNIEGSFAPLSEDLVGSLLKNVQALVRDSMWNTAANTTILEMVMARTLPTPEDPNGIAAPEAREQRFLTMDDVKEGDKAAFAEANDPLIPNQAEFTETQKNIMYRRRNLFTKQQLSDMGFSDQTIRIKVKGEAKFYRTLDPEMAMAVMSVGVSPTQTLETFFTENLHMSKKWATGATKLLLGASNLLRNAVTLSPVFWGKNVLRDSMQASVTFGHGRKIIMGAFKNFLLGEVGAFKKDGMGAYERAQRLGLAVGIDFVKDPKRAHEQAERLVKEQKMEWDTPLDLVKNVLWAGPVRKLKRFAGQSEIATRLAIYDKVMADTDGNQAQAFQQALEIINYGRRGNSAWFGALTAMAPFMNGRIQGLDVMWRTHIGSVDVPGLYMDDKNVIPEEVLTRALSVDADGNYMVAMPSDYKKLMQGSNAMRRLMRTMRRGMMISMGTLIYTMWRYDDDDYKNAREDEKNDYWLMPWGLKIPIPFEVGTLYKVIPEQIFRWVMEKEHDAGDVTHEARRQIIASLGLDPTPQLIKPAFDAFFNIDRFQKDNIVPQWMSDDLLSSAQMRSNTSYVARGVAKSMSVIPLVNKLDFLTSPMKMEYLLRQQFGTLGAYAITTTDALWAWSNDINRAGTAYNFGISSLWSPIVDHEWVGGNRTLHEEWNKVPILGDLLFDPKEGGGYQEDFYEWVETLDAIVTTLGQLEETDPDEARAFEKKHETMLKHKNRLRHFETQMDFWRDQRDFLLERKDLTREEKQRQLVRSYEQRDEMLKAMVDIMADVKGSRSFGDKLRSIMGPS